MKKNFKREQIDPTIFNLLTVVYNKYKSGVDWKKNKQFAKDLLKFVKDYK